MAISVKELVSLHDHHIMAAKLDDNLDEDQEIELQTKELTEVCWILWLKHKIHWPFSFLHSAIANYRN